MTTQLCMFSQCCWNTAFKNMQVYTSVNYHYSEDPEFVQTECVVPEPTQSSSNSPQKVSSSKFLKLVDISHVPRYLHVREMAWCRGPLEHFLEMKVIVTTSACLIHWFLHTTSEASPALLKLLVLVCRMEGCIKCIKVTRFDLICWELRENHRYLRRHVGLQFLLSYADLSQSTWTGEIFYSHLCFLVWKATQALANSGSKFHFLKETYFFWCVSLFHHWTGMPLLKTSIMNNSGH